MSLHAVRDEFLARQAKIGDEIAFAELVRRYRPLLASAARGPVEGIEAEDAWQAALIGLMEACRATDGVRRFAGIASVRVHWKVSVTRRAARARKQRILTDAARDGHQAQLARLPAPEGADPARVIELRESLRERAHECAMAARRRADAPGGDLRRRYSDEKKRRALAMIADGATYTASAAVIGAPHPTVWRWAHKHA